MQKFRARGGCLRSAESTARTGIAASQIFAGNRFERSHGSLPAHPVGPSLGHAPEETVDAFPIVLQAAADPLAGLGSGHFGQESQEQGRDSEQNGRPHARDRVTLTGPSLTLTVDLHGGQGLLAAAHANGHQEGHAHDAGDVQPAAAGHFPLLIQRPLPGHVSVELRQIPGQKGRPVASRSRADRCTDLTRLGNFKGKGQKIINATANFP